MASAVLMNYLVESGKERQAEPPRIQVYTFIRIFFWLLR
jgi:hypothetical protein